MMSFVRVFVLMLMGLWGIDGACPVTNNCMTCTILPACSLFHFRSGIELCLEHNSQLPRGEFVTVRVKWPRECHFLAELKIQDTNDIEDIEDEENPIPEKSISDDYVNAVKELTESDNADRSLVYEGFWSWENILAIVGSGITLLGIIWGIYECIQKCRNRSGDHRRLIEDLVDP